MTKHGFILDEPKYHEAYKKKHSKNWLSILGATDESEIVYDEVEDDGEVDEDDIVDKKEKAKLNLKKKLLEDID